MLIGWINRYKEVLRLGLVPMLVCVCLLGCLHAAPSRAGELPKELKLKAALIYKLAKFVTWPTAAFTDKKQDFSLCVLAPDPFGQALVAVEGMLVRGRRVAIRRPPEVEQARSSCHALFIPKTHRASLRNILNSLKGYPILTVSDMNDFAEMGGMIAIEQQKRRLGFRINLNAANRTELKIASPLLNIATVIREVRD